MRAFAGSDGNYGAYLNSAEWKAKRAERLALDGYKCRLCGSAKNLHVHHVAYPDYGRLGNEGMEELIALCSSCHKSLHRGEAAADEARKAKQQAISSFTWAERSEAAALVRGAFASWGLAQCRRRGLNPFSIDDRRMLEDEFQKRFPAATDVTPGTLIELAAMERRKTIDAAILNGETPQEITEKHGIERKAVLKEKNRIKKIGDAMKIMNWDAVEATGNGGGRKSLPAGSYVVILTDATDVESREYVEVTFDVAEGEHRGHYGDDWGKSNAWAHTFKVSYKQKAEGLFKYFLECLATSNPGFNIAQWQSTGNVGAFIGKTIGVAWGTELYTKADGSDGERKTFPVWYPAQDVRDGKAKPPADVDKRDKGASPAVAAQPKPAYDDLPF